MKFISGLVVGFLACYFIIKKSDAPTKTTQTESPQLEERLPPKAAKHRAGKMDLPQEAALPDFKPQPVEVEAKMEMTSRMPV